MAFWIPLWQLSMQVNLKIKCCENTQFTHNFFTFHNDAFSRTKISKVVRFFWFYTNMPSCQIICAEKSLFRTGGGGKSLPKFLDPYPPLLEVWSAHVEGKVEIKYIPTFGRGSENVIRFNFWPLFVTKKCILWFFSFYA